MIHSESTRKKGMPVIEIRLWDPGSAEQRKRTETVFRNEPDFIRTIRSLREKARPTLIL